MPFHLYFIWINELDDSYPIEKKTMGATNSTP